MPTLECLDERSRSILEQLKQMTGHFDSSLNSVRESLDARDSSLEQRLEKLEADILAIKLFHAQEDGKRSIILWVGGIAFMALSSMFGAVGNIIYTWMTKPGGILGN